VAVPTYDQFIEPILRYLADHVEGASASDVYEAAAERLKISDAEKIELIPSGQPKYKNRAGWAHDRLKRAGLSSSPRRGYWKLTKSGLDYAKSHPTPLSPAEVEEIAFTAHRSVPLGSRVEPNEFAQNSVVPEGASLPQLSASPDDRLDQAVGELRAATARDLLEVIGRGSPRFFEVLVLDLLHAMGYGTSRADLQHVGRTGDGGIDGVISLDRLGLEKVFVQAKRWHGSVGREPVQAFYGALAGQRANKGVFITTSSFTPQALEFARSVEKVVLVDGAKLTELLMEHGVGVTHRAIKIPKIDNDYFEE